MLPPGASPRLPPSSPVSFATGHSSGAAGALHRKNGADPAAGSCRDSATTQNHADPGPLLHQASRALRIALDLRCVHPNLTGIGRYGANVILSVESASSQHSFFAITTAAGGAYLDAVGLRSPRLIADSSPSWERFALPDLLHDLRVDLVHSPLFVLPTLRSYASIITVHDVIPFVRPDICPPSFLEFFRQHIQPAVRRATHIVTVSDHSRSDLMRALSVEPSRITAIHEPVSPLFSTGARADDNAVLARLDIRPGFVLSVGAIDRRKNLDTLLEAFQPLRNRMAAAPSLVVVGGPSGDGYDLGAAIAARHLGDVVRTLGRVSDSDLAALYRAATALAFPSLYEGFGLPVVEAMASGTPVLASNASSLPEVAGDAAVLLPPTDADAWTRALIRIVEDEALRSDLVARGLERARHFSIERHGAALLALYERVVEGRR